MGVRGTLYLYSALTLTLNPMNIQHFEKGFHYNDRQMLHIAKKIGKMATYCKKLKDESSTIRVEAESRKTEKKRDAMKVMITITLPQKTLRAESRRPDVIEAVDRCLEKLHPQLEKFKQKQMPKQRARNAAKNRSKSR